MIYYYFIRASFEKGSQFIIKSYIVSFVNLYDFFSYLKTKKSSQVLLIKPYEYSYIRNYGADRRFYEISHML